MKNRIRKFRRPMTNGYHYIQLDAQILESPAYRDLTPLARALLIEFLIVYRPSRNGVLSLPTRKTAKRLNVTENTVTNAFHDLLEHGFIRLDGEAMYNARLAREWMLTFMPMNNREPSDDWQRWDKGKVVFYIPYAKKYRSQKLRQTASSSEAALHENLQQHKNCLVADVIPIVKETKA